MEQTTTSLPERGYLNNRTRMEVKWMETEIVLPYAASVLPTFE